MKKLKKFNSLKWREEIKLKNFATYVKYSTIS